MDYFGDGGGISPATGKSFGVNIQYYFEKEPLGNAGALFKIKDKLDSDFLLLNADAVFDVQRGDAVYFSKRLNKAVATNDTIDGHFDICDSLDYEVELGVIIGKDAKNVKAADAAEYIFGYTIINDVSARNLQTRHKQWYFGKSLDGFTPMGPYIRSAEELGAMPELNIRCYVNDELRQNSNTRMMIFDIPYIIEELSAGMTLKAGTVIATGTPSGVALGMDPAVRQYLKSGDVVRCEIDGLGILENTIG